ncbi:hypothetical protein Vadar_010948 [Vaccinium darrowii]|uniref:Uncharacterized protein n=1 Tax=Vaccinium darrowii TaxID=229202 RepID=A0ACB7X9G7_9ERIC|nr:hypothetical protein Vadar_010948 [Vaccinium darrowii]
MTSRSSKNPGRRYYKCPRAPPCGTWNGWREESSPRTTSLAQPNDPNGSQIGTASAIATLHDDVASLQPEHREILNSMRTLKTIIFAVCVVQVVLLLRSAYMSLECNTYTVEAHTSSFHGGTSGGACGGHGQSPETNIHVGSSLFVVCGGTSGGAWGGHGQSPPPSHGSRQYDNWEAYVQRSWNEGYGMRTNDHLEDENDKFSLRGDETIEWKNELEQEEDYETLRTLEVFRALREQIDQGGKKKVPFHTSPLQGKEYMKDLFKSCKKRFYRELKMPKQTFIKIVEELETIYGWRMGRKNAITCFEAFAIFIQLLQGKTNGDIQERFQHSLETGKCVGALDGTHVKLQFRKKKKEDGLVFRGRKGYPTTNILAVCDFDLTFTYVSCGWDGISHDHHIFKQVTRDPLYKFPHPEQGKFYLVDAGYPNAVGYLAPYKGYRYHQEEFIRGLRPINDGREYFNRAHFSLCSVIERTFGVWKKRFRILENMPMYSLKTQVQIILASIVIHNFIRRDQPDERMFAKAVNPAEYVFQDLEDEDPKQLDREDDPASGEGVPNHEHDANMNDVRNYIRTQLRRLRRGGGMRNQSRSRNWLMRKAFALMNLCANSEATTDIAERNMDRTFEEVRIYNASLCGGDRSDVGDTSIPVVDVPMMDPPRRRKKGVANGRLKGALERKRKRKRKTSRNVTNSNPTPDFQMQSKAMQPPGSSTLTPNDLRSPTKSNPRPFIFFFFLTIPISTSIIPIQPTLQRRRPSLSPNRSSVQNRFTPPFSKRISHRRQTHCWPRIYDLFLDSNANETVTPGVVMIGGQLTFWLPSFAGFPSGNFTQMINYRAPHGVSRHSLEFRLHGFWSQDDGKLCMVGSGTSDLISVNVGFKLNYPNSSTLDSSLVTGTLECLDNLSCFDKISILGFSAMGNYEYKVVDKENENGGFMAFDGMENVSLGFDSGLAMCSAIMSAGRLVLKYMEDCGYNGHRSPFSPSTLLVAEGLWNGMKKHLDLVACRIFNVEDTMGKASLGDCSIRLSLRLPSTLSLRSRSTVVGQIWSNRSMNDSGYLGRISFRSPRNGNTALEGLRYEYTEVEQLSKSCTGNIPGRHRKGTYTNPYSSDMRLDMTARDHDFLIGGEEPSMKRVEISAEGTYGAETGVLCKKGCRHLESQNKRFPKNESLDCEIFINIMFPPLNANDGSIMKGTIESNRNKSDPLHFERIDLFATSISFRQAKESIWRMVLEIVVFLISYTLACIFVGLQLFHVKKNPDGLPFISIVMLTILTIALMIPLVLNFEALFVLNNRLTVSLGSGGWLEVNKVVVRVIRMVAFLLQFRLLQQTWSARVGGDGSWNSLWVSDKRVLYFSLPLYIGGGLIAWFVHPWKDSYNSRLLPLRHVGF